MNGRGKTKSKKSTISQPSRNDSIESAAKILARHILTTSSRGKEAKSAACDRMCYYDVDNFVRQRFSTSVPVSVGLMSSVSQRTRVNILPFPDSALIYKFIKRIVTLGRLHSEAIIISLIYIERLVSQRNIGLSLKNWIPIVTAALLTVCAYV
jgi:hypothetical protein